MASSQPLPAVGTGSSFLLGAGLKKKDPCFFWGVGGGSGLHTVKNVKGRNFPGGPAIKTLRFQCRGRRFDTWSENEDPTCCAAQPKKNVKCSEHLWSNDCALGIQLNSASAGTLCDPGQATVLQDSQR